MRDDDAGDWLQFALFAAGMAAAGVYFFVIIQIL